MNSELVELKNKWERKTNQQYENRVSNEKNRLGKPYFKKAQEAISTLLSMLSTYYIEDKKGILEL